jgi:cytidylate kinase
VPANQPRTEREKVPFRSRRFQHLHGIDADAMAPYPFSAHTSRINR